MIEVSHDEDEKSELRNEIAEIRERVVEVGLPLADGSGETEELEMQYDQLEAEFLGLQQRRAQLQAERLEALGEANRLRADRDSLMSDRLVGLGATQIDGLIAKMRDFSIGIKQIHLLDIDLVDRCESCHLGIREPVEIGPTDLIYPVFQSHPRPELLEIHDPEAFGCSSCHNGNGRATRSITKGHGRHKFWLWPMYQPENVEAGCQQCHGKEIVTVGGETLNKGRELYMNKGCWGCHRFEGFDAESEELTLVRQEMRNLDSTRNANAKEMRVSLDLGDTSTDGAAAQQFYARAEELRLTNTRLDAEIHNLTVEEDEPGTRGQEVRPEPQRDPGEGCQGMDPGMDREPARVPARVQDAGFPPGRRGSPADFGLPVAERPGGRAGPASPGRCRKRPGAVRDQGLPGLSLHRRGRQPNRRSVRGEPQQGRREDGLRVHGALDP